MRIVWLCFMIIKDWVISSSPHLWHELQSRSHRICEFEEHGNSNLVLQKPVVDGLGGAAEFGADCLEVVVVQLHFDEEGIEPL